MALESVFHRRQIPLLSIDETKSISVVSGKVEAVQSKLDVILNRLSTIETRPHEEHTVQNWVERVKLLALRINDIREKYEVAYDSNPRGRGNGLKRILQGLRLMITQDPSIKALLNITSVEKEIIDLNKFIEISDMISRANEENGRQLSKSYDHEVDVYVEDQDVQNVTLMITDDEQDTFMTIFGERGLGKTTLVNQVINREEVRKCFESRRALTIITHQCDHRTVLQDLLRKIGRDGTNGEIKGLITALQSVLEEKKCLLVIDGISSVNDLTFFREAFATAKKSGSKVLFTTHDSEVAEIVQCYKLELWTEDKSWTLLHRISGWDTAFDGETKRKWEHIGRQIVLKCGRLPRAMIAVGRIIKRRLHSKEWDSLLWQIDKYLEIVRSTSVETALALEYDNLSFRLKQSLLYMAMFPTNEPVEATRLCQLWMAEGIVLEEGGASNKVSMDEVEDNLQELVSRNMVEVVRRNKVTKRIEWCKLDERIRDISYKVRKKEGFFETLEIGFFKGNAQTKTPTDFNSKATRLSISLHVGGDYSSESDCIEPSKVLERMQSLRVLLVTNKTNYKNNEIPWKFKLLKVLEFDGCSFPKKQIPKEIFNMFSLRYLLLNPTQEIELPLSAATAFPYLQTLYLLASHPIYLHDIFGKMKLLMHLHLGYHCRPLRTVKLQLKGLDKLEVLHVENCSIVKLEDLPELSNLEHVVLGIQTDGLVAETEHLKRLRETIWVKVATELPIDLINDDTSNLLGSLLVLDKLNDLAIKGTFKFPAYQAQFWRRLSRLTIERALLEGDPMQFLKCLPKLQELRLEDNRFVKEEIICDGNAFPELVSLTISWCSYVKRWRVEKEAFPELSNLVIVGCQHLKEIIPADGLIKLPKLKEIKIRHMPTEFEYGMFH